MNLTEKFWEKVYSDNIAKMIGTCYRYVQNKEIAEDLVHDAFLMAMKKSGTFKGTGCFEAWPRRIVVNSALQYLRKQKTDRNHEGLLRSEEIIEIVEEKPDKHINEQSDFSKEELLEAINKLPEHHRLVFNMYVIDNYSHAQIASELGISTGTSKSHLARARKNIKKQLIENQEKNRRKRALLFIIFPYKYIDKLYKNHFKNFEINPVKSISFNKINWETIIKPNISNLFISPGMFVVSGISIFVAVSLVFIIHKNNLPIKDNVIVIQSDTIQTEKITEDTIKEKIKPAISKTSVVLFDSTSPKKPVIIKKTIVKHKAVVIKNTINISDSIK